MANGPPYYANETPLVNALATTLRTGRGRNLGGAAAGALRALLLCGIAQAQDLPMGTHRVVAADAVALLHDADPMVRGEATLIVAARSDPHAHGTIVAAAEADDDPARPLAIIALGLQATPGTAAVLDAVLADSQSRAQPIGIAAALGLGLLPPDSAPTVTSRVLIGFQHGNMKRDSGALLALLLGLGRRDPAPQAAALRALFDNESTRDPQIRAELLHLLLRTERAFGGDELRRLLERSSDPERTALLRWLAQNDSGCDAQLLPCLERTARHGARPEHRAAALAALTRLQHLPALELAAQLMRSEHAIESAQGLRSVLAIGGAGMRGALERHLLEEKDHARKAVLLANYDAPPGAELVGHAAKLAADPVQPSDVRTAAALLLARSDPGRAAPMLRDLFRTTEATGTLGQIATALMRGGEPPPLTRLLDGPADLRQHPRRWQALLAAEHPQAVRHLLASVQRGGPPGQTALALRLWRATMVLPMPRPVVGDPPPALRALLGD
jgi:hypothetical protein